MADGDDPGCSRRDLIASAAATTLSATLIAAIGPAEAATLVPENGAPTPTSAETAYPPRPIPARDLPVPTTISPELAAYVAMPYPADWDTIPTDAAGWRAKRDASVTQIAPLLPGLKERLGIRVERDVIAGVPVFVSTPKEIAPRNANRVFVHLHGGAYVLYPGEVGAGEGMLMAAYGRCTVISVDYRMPPDHPFPAALDDAVAVWRALVAAHDPKRMAIFGASAGGGLTLATLLRLKAEGLPLPAAIAPGTPWADLTGAGDSSAANAYVDNVLVSEKSWLPDAARLYAAGRALDDPLISPLFGDFNGFPPAILTSGTRDLLLSNTVRTHRKLRRAGIEAVLQVFEAQSHAQYLMPFVPETEDAFAEITAFLDRHLAV
ncbi:alpha/beta hydrolase [Segnochrobactrum spirostomi]|uniref:Alpha/beta hydrolase n=1 Tax=Segnochrobactrum spirostomi TaxID=2608987 RepID=A0A6A7Y0W6_9HYPH|nr:alpha/beta hydrolase [Segnochrobactrum spirostomi]MQT12395.1 alpha/beta hydrolase [Segnochrobactrum spirostomi]